MNRKDLYPLKFHEIIRSYGVGGRKIPNKYNKDLPEDKKIAETWEVSDHDKDISIVKNGDWRDKNLRGLIWELREKLLGDEVFNTFNMFFPLLLKLLDARETLAVQIHPDDEYARANHLDHNGKAEVYHVLETREDSTIHWGVKDGVTEEEMAEAIRAGKGLELTQEVPVEPGDTIPIPHRWIHAIGDGIIVLELQQNADVTFEPGRVKKSINNKEYELYTGSDAADIFIDQMIVEQVPRDQAKITPVSVSLGRNEREYRYASEKFALELLRLKEEYHTSSDQDKFYLYTALEGKGTIDYSGGEELIVKGDTVLIPAYLGDYSINPEPSCELAKCFVPDLKSDIVNPLREKGIEKEAIVGLGGYSSFNDVQGYLGDSGQATNNQSK